MKVRYNLQILELSQNSFFKWRGVVFWQYFGYTGQDSAVIKYYFLMKTFDWYENILYEKNWYQKKLISKFAKFCSMNPMDVPKKLWGISKKKKTSRQP